MDVAIYNKFTRHKDLKRELSAIANWLRFVLLAEPSSPTRAYGSPQNSDKDAFWGCGADANGRNELGKAPERLRAQLHKAERCL
ncbi:hypothetical protein BDM02DRAFT_3103980 [Thelephora ganbajun]|uniref:Uncharacterized protein n=1 Tax=Thelephora ganbajun TaxID=370292 RepID=A0ACB6Z226_THEGA|nr:hypothetical protein BDM02DRAFT_3103980 [Thelephora ganbajun]